MLNLSRFKPHFWDHVDAAAGPDRRPFSFRRKWLMIVAFTTVVTLAPLLVMALVDYRLTRQAFETEATLMVSRVVSNSRRNVTFMLAQRRAALSLIARDNTLAGLTAPGRLMGLLSHLQTIMGGFIGLDVVDAERRIRAFAGSHALVDNRLKPGECFDHAVADGFFVGDVMFGPTQNHQLVIAVRQDLESGGFFVLRGALEVDLFDEFMSQLVHNTADDAFIVNAQGVLQTPSIRYGRRFEKALLALPEDADETQVAYIQDPNGRPVLAGVARIADSPFWLLLIRPQSGIMDLWLKPRIRLIGFLIFSIALILASILGVATYLVNRIHAADQRRVHALHQVEYANKLASIGRLASGVAHEVNNPLAIINQKAGLIKDLFTINREQAGNEKLIGLVEDVLASVQRCGAITRRLLDFSRHMDASIEKVNVENIICQVLAFMEKEAQRRCIAVSVKTKGSLPEFSADRGNLQQIFLNLINNAFAAMQDGGRLEVFIQRQGADRICVTVADTGRGIAEADLKRVFEPFFSTRHGHAGTGLGLSVTYGMVSEMGGTISVDSQVNRGTRFTVTLPLVPPAVAVQRHTPVSEIGCGDNGQSTQGERA